MICWASTEKLAKDIYITYPVFGQAFSTLLAAVDALHSLKFGYYPFPDQDH